MKIVCYAFINLENKLESPFLNYLEKYAFSPKDSHKIRNRKVKQVGNIKAYLEFLLENEGFYNIPPAVQKYRNRDIGILKIKEAEKLVRIAFFTKHLDSLVLLGAMDKPKLYEKGDKLRVDREIEKFLNQMELYRLDYIKNFYFKSLYFPHL